MSLEAIKLLFMVAQGDRPTLYEVKRCYAQVVVAECKTLKEAAMVLGVKPSTIYRWRREDPPMLQTRATNFNEEPPHRKRHFNEIPPERETREPTS